MDTRRLISVGPLELHPETIPILIYSSPVRWTIILTEKGGGHPTTGYVRVQGLGVHTT